MNSVFFHFESNPIGLMEFAGVDKAARSKMGVWKMQEWTYRHDMARVDIAGMDNASPYSRGGLCRSGHCGTILARVDNAGGKNVSKLA